MAFGIIRVRNLKSGDISSTEEHNARLYKSKDLFPDNINSEGDFDVEYFNESTDSILCSHLEFTLQELIKNRIEKNNVKGIRKNSNVAIEYVCGINDKRAWENYSVKGFANNCYDWLEKRHGQGSIVAKYIHEDESNPHIHFVVVPLKTKKVKWKNQQGEGERVETRLNTREFTGGRKILSKLQDNYHSHLIDTYQARDYNKLGVPLYRGIKAVDNFKKYSMRTNSEISILRDSLAEANDEVSKLEIMLDIERKKAEKVQKEIDYNTELSIHQLRSKKNWKEKGTRDNPVIFHIKEDPKPTEKLSEDSKRKRKKGRRF